MSVMAVMVVRSQAIR